MNQFGEWRLTSDEAIGGGQFGKLYEVVRNAPGTNVSQYGALKLVGDASNTAMRESIENEIASYASLESPFIPTFYEAGWDEQLGPWFIVALIKGKTLKDFLSSGAKLSRDDWYEFVDDILSALISVHGKGLTHLDIWMPNLMKIDSGQWMLIDFGLTVKEFAKPLASNWGWGAPEQYIEGSVPTSAADIFALANSFYFALTGKNPFDVYYPVFYHEAVQRFAPNLLEVDPDIRDFLAPMFAINPQQRPTAVHLKKNLKILRGLESGSASAEDYISSWQQLQELVSRKLESDGDFRLTLKQPGGIKAEVDILVEDDGCRIGFNSEKFLGKVLSSTGRIKLAELEFAIEPSGRYSTRKHKQLGEVPEIVVSLARDCLQLSLAELLYEFN